MKKNLILGVIDNYSFHRLKVFAYSIRKISFQGDVRLLVGPNITPRTRRQLRKLGFYLHPFEGLGKLPADNLALKKFTLPYPINYFNFRHYLYYDVVQRHQDTYENVMLTDTRDVFFQSDPFSFPIGDSLCCALEGESMKIRDCAINRPWVESIYGKEGLNEIGDEVISCAGTTWGRSSVILDYLTEMISQIEGLPDASAAIDQAVHNYLIYTGALRNVELQRNDGGVVLSIANEKGYKIDQLDRVIVGGDKVVSTIHQFPARPELVELTDRIYFGGPIRSFIDRVSYKFDLVMHKSLRRAGLR